MQTYLSRRGAFLLFAVIVIAWGLNWTITKTLVQSVTPLWTTAFRSGIATVALAALLFARGEMIVPRRGDLPVVFVTSIFHLVAFSALVAYGLQFAAVGRSIVLGYTTPLWVMPAAWLFLGERMTPSRSLGMALGLAGLTVMFNPLAFNWADVNTLAGSGAILLAALCWAVSIVYVRAHRWISTPFQLVFWQMLLATVVVSVLALLKDGVPHPAWSAQLAGLFLFSGIIGTALANWAMSTANRSLPAVVTSLGLLATPVVGVASSAIVLGEVVTADLVVAMLLILGGIAIGTIPRREKTPAQKHAPLVVES
ncbi:DMT family transporter [Bradyrhizobium sp. AUGA SZCCT0222]|uniref:DMT family transporter n=1 Tax=Bradyrhizobium sp. AUGA SZCCT0222 TaxID=2807668 RepID=UPI001BA5DE9A|nr:DMT family transporter [Bradyrhizobium sp. AUGA SZCCT0222]MBR1269860.1 DMT family transporter [Bradyrhizobium sp. AUGA SZCCT0222]